MNSLKTAIHIFVLLVFGERRGSPAKEKERKKRDRGKRGTA
jgi:hypothetical protein